MSISSWIFLVSIAVQSIAVHAGDNDLSLRVLDWSPTTEWKKVKVAFTSDTRGTSVTAHKVILPNELEDDRQELRDRDRFVTPIFVTKGKNLYVKASVFHYRTEDYGFGDLNPFGSEAPPEYVDVNKLNYFPIGRIDADGRVAVDPSVKIELRRFLFATRAKVQFLKLNRCDGLATLVGGKTESWPFVGW